MDPLAGSPWSKPETVAGFSTSPANATLIAFARDELTRARGRVAFDLGCGAARNAAPLAAEGWQVYGVDLSLPMLEAARERVIRELAEPARIHFALAPMEQLPFVDRCGDLVIAHGIWNLARSGAQFRAAVHEAARVATPGAALFVFTFSRNTLTPDAQPVAGESFVFTQFSGEPQCFLTEEQLVDELAAGGFIRDAAIALRELNRPQSRALTASRAPVIYEGVFRRRP